MNRQFNPIFNVFRIGKRIIYRKSHGHHHGTSDAKHASHASEPYAAKHHPSIYPSEALPFGRKPGDKLEGWEVITLGTVFIACGMLIYSFYSDADTIRDWAKREAIAREKIIASGGEIEFGKYYQGTKSIYVAGEIDKMPTTEDEE